MDRHGWARIAVLPITLLLAAGLAGCGSKPAAPATNKRLTERICDLVKHEDIEDTLGEFVTESRSQDGRQCHFDFKNGNAQVEREIEKAQGGEAIEVDGVSANRLQRSGEPCRIDAWLTPGDISQQFTVESETIAAGPDAPDSCKVATTLVRIIVGRLPDPGAPVSNKRMTDQGPCDLAKIEDLENIFGPVDNDPGPHQDRQQCNYEFENGHLSISRAAEGARPGTPFQIDGVAAKKFEKDSLCVIDVWLMPGDINQQFGIFGKITGNDTCDANISVARLILNRLPG